jgi:hypothetical protein
MSVQDKPHALKPGSRGISFQHFAAKWKYKADGLST